MCGPPRMNSGRESGSNEFSVTAPSVARRRRRTWFATASASKRTIPSRRSAALTRRVPVFRITMSACAVVPRDGLGIDGFGDGFGAKHAQQPQPSLREVPISSGNREELRLIERMLHNDTDFADHPLGPLGYRTEVRIGPAGFYKKVGAGSSAAGRSLAARRRMRRTRRIKAAWARRTCRRRRSRSRRRICAR